MIQYFIDIIKLLLTKTYAIIILRTFISLTKARQFLLLYNFGFIRYKYYKSIVCLITLNALIILIKTLSQMSTCILDHLVITNINSSKTSCLLF